MPDRHIFMLSKVQNRLSAFLKRELKKNGVELSPGQIGILFALDRDRQTTMGKLGQELDTDNAAITRLVEKLEKKGLVERRINPDDRRQILIAITAEGRNKAAAAQKVAKAANSRIKEGFTEEEMATYHRVNAGIIEKFSKR